MNIVDRLPAAALGIPFVWLGYEAAAEPGNRVKLAAKTGTRQSRSCGLKQL
jgi:hypothetical protein